jgi:hypothetical protein
MPHQSLKFLAPRFDLAAARRCPSFIESAPFPSEAIGQGSNNPGSQSTDRPAGMEPAHSSPFRIKPHRGKVIEDLAQPASVEERGIFNQDASRLNFPDDSSSFDPKATACSGDANCSRIGFADVLAGKSRRYHRSNSSPWNAVKRSHVIPDRKGFKAVIVLPCEENAAAEGIEFNSADSPPTEEFAPKYPSTSAREKCQLIEHRS